MTDYDAIIIGGGHNGLISAAYMARAGLKTLVLERRSILGGACVTEEIPGATGYRVSTGAAQLGNLRPEIIADLDLEALGYELLLPDPLSVFVFPDDRYLALWLDADRTRTEFAKFSKADAAALPAFQRDCGTFCELIEPLLYADQTTTLDAVQSAFEDADRPDLYRDFMIGGIWDLLQDRFQSDAVKAVLGFPGTFGSNAGPRDPGTAYVMAHHLFGGTAGVRGRTGYVRGGMGGLADALCRAATRHGAELRTNAEVARIIMENGTARGVELVNGNRLNGAAVISNADPHGTFLGLVDRTTLSPDFAAAVQAIQMQGVALKVNCALKRLPRFNALPSELVPARVGLCPSLDYMQAAWDDAKLGYPSANPFMTIHMQSAIDPSLAPPGRHGLTCYAHYFPYNLNPSMGDWDSARDRAGAIVLGKLAEVAPDLHDVIEQTEILTPLDIERRFAMTGGHQFHGDMMLPGLFDKRPAPGCDGARTPIDGLYLCGAGAHPGGCVWGAPGERAARAVLADLT